MYLLNLGFVSVYLSSHMISGFTCGAAFHVMMSQIPKLVNIKIDRQIGYSTFVKVLSCLINNLEIGFKKKDLKDLLEIIYYLL